MSAANRRRNGCLRLGALGDFGRWIGNFQEDDRSDFIRRFGGQGNDQAVGGLTEF